MALTDKQGAFVREYLVDHCATQAAIRAGYSSDTANEQGARLLANVSVRREIDRLIAERSERVQIDADAVVRRFDTLYYEALVANDLSTAARCLEGWPSVPARSRSTTSRSGSTPRRTWNG